MYRITYLYKGKRKVGALCDCAMVKRIQGLAARVHMPILKIEFNIPNSQVFIPILISTTFKVP